MCHLPALTPPSLCAPSTPHPLKQIAGTRSAIQACLTQHVPRQCFAAAFGNLIVLNDHSTFSTGHNCTCCKVRTWTHPRLDQVIVHSEEQGDDGRCATHPTPGQGNVENVDCDEHMHQGCRRPCPAGSARSRRGLSWPFCRSHGGTARKYVFPLLLCPCAEMSVTILCSQETSLCPVSHFHVQCAR